MENLREAARGLGRSLLVCTVCAALALWSAGELRLLPALILGFLLGGASWTATALRLHRAASLPVGAAKRQMLWGLLLRLFMLFAVLLAAIHISLTVFAMVAVGFALSYVLGLFFLLRLAYRQKL